MTMNLTNQQSPIARFLRRSGVAFLVVISMLHSGSQNLPSYWQNWSAARTNWQLAQQNHCRAFATDQPLDSNRSFDSLCAHQWRMFLRSTMDYNREVSQLPGLLWKRWLHKDLPDCVIISAWEVPTGGRFSAATATRFCSS